jgi:hypothetical protein
LTEGENSQIIRNERVMSRKSHLTLLGLNGTDWFSFEL